MELPFSGKLTQLNAAIAGRKTYIALACGMAVIALNHFQLLPEGLAPDGLDPKNWVSDEYKLLLTSFMRAGVAKAGSHV